MKIVKLNESVKLTEDRSRGLLIKIDATPESVQAACEAGKLNIPAVDSEGFENCIGQHSLIVRFPNGKNIFDFLNIYDEVCEFHYTLYDNDIKYEVDGGISAINRMVKTRQITDSVRHIIDSCASALRDAGIEIMNTNVRVVGGRGEYEFDEDLDLKESFDEALTYKEATNPGRGNCSPTAFECADLIKDALDHIGDERYTKSATAQLKYCAKRLLDSKQDFENFNNYWNERFPAMIDFLDNQLTMIPKEIIANLGNSIEEDLRDKIRKNELDYNDEIDALEAEENGTKIELQDRETHTDEFRTAKNKYGREYVAGQINRQPKTSSNTWGRVWKNDGEFKQFEGPKYKVRDEMIKYLGEDVNKQIIIGFSKDGGRKYYNVDKEDHWVEDQNDATIFEDHDSAMNTWFFIDKKPFKRVFVANHINDN